MTERVSRCVRCGSDIMNPPSGRLARYCLKCVGRPALRVGYMPEVRECVVCGEVLPARPPGKTGPPRRYCSVACRSVIRNNHLRRKRYGIDTGQRDKLMEVQGDKCAICATDLGLVKACIDHDHATGVVRGILCDRCNRGLGQFGDDPALLDAGASYLRKKNHG